MCLLGEEGINHWNIEVSYQDRVVCSKVVTGTDTPEKTYKSLLIQYKPCPDGRKSYVPKGSLQPGSVSRVPAWFEMVFAQEDICWVKAFKTLLQSYNLSENLGTWMRLNENSRSGCEAKTKPWLAHGPRTALVPAEELPLSTHHYLEL